MGGEEDFLMMKRFIFLFITGVVLIFSPINNVQAISPTY